MKKSLLALAALTAFAGVASAQSSVTIFGVIDASARSVKNGSAGTLKTLSTDGMGSSRLGFRGVEDLGGGLRASFWLEGSVNVDTGGGQKAATQYVSPAGSTTNVGLNPSTVGNAANGNFYTGQDWQRRATVSLSGGFGEIRLGRDYTPDFWNHTVFDPFGTNGVASSYNLYTPGGLPSALGVQTSTRANNTIGYFLPALGGLYGQLQVAAGENTLGNKEGSARIGYAAGPVNVAAAYGRTVIGNGSRYNRYNLGASFNVGFLTLMGQYIHGEVEGGAQNNRKVTNYLVGGIIPIGAGNIKFSYVKANAGGGTPVQNALDADQIGVGYQYSLSKRTAIYAHYARIDNESGAGYTASSGGPAFGGLRGFKSTGYELGVNHSF